LTLPGEISRFPWAEKPDLLVKIYRECNPRSGFFGSSQPVLRQNPKFLAKLGYVRILKGFFGLRSKCPPVGHYPKIQRFGELPRVTSNLAILAIGP